MCHSGGELNFSNIRTLFVSLRFGLSQRNLRFHFEKPDELFYLQFTPLHVIYFHVEMLNELHYLEFTPPPPVIYFLKPPRDVCGIQMELLN